MIENINESERAQIELCKMWINKFTVPTVHFRHNRTSYGYKHYVERYYHTYISNNSFLIAAKELNFDSLPDKHSPHHYYFKFRIIPTYIKIQKYPRGNDAEVILQMELREKMTET